ncbi:peptide ABC transporter substrate-binding protein [beta proteobacterium AAP121]|nr:peptide ABC transporter substrate-binding protein [beta proteobacterium AAP65]KPF94316.1 peptide ABC transporter substrate-binding protein [beta proteobacterium AAP121]
MQDTELRSLIEAVREGALPRRAFVQRLAAAGLAAPLAGMLLMHSGVAQAQPANPPYKPTKRGGGGALKTLSWQGATLLQPHFASGTKDQEASRIFYEPLASWDRDANLVPVLAAELPTRENGGLSADGRSVIWKLKKGVTWHDGKPFTADDCVFTWAYARDPATAAVTLGIYRDVTVTKVDSHTVRVTFPKPTPFWATAFCATEGMVLPKHHFEAYAGAKSREAPANLAPIGTGPYVFVEFKPGDIVRGKLNPNYHQPNRPYFDTIEVKGGGDAPSAARTVLQSGEYDFAWNLQVEDELLKRMENGGKGRAVYLPSGDVEFVQLNPTDPNTEVDGERSSLKTQHPAFADKAVRQAMVLLCDRKAVETFIYGRGGAATANFLNNPARFRSPNNQVEFNIDKANQLLDAAGWKRGRGGVREKNGKPLRLLFQTSTNGPRQKVQAIIKQACGKAGIELELKSISGSVFFSSDVGNPDTYGKFYADMQMYTTTMNQPDPERLMDQYLSREVSNKANKWQGRNISRYRNPVYDSTYAQMELELDPVKRAALFIQLNDLPVQDFAIIPLSSRTRVRGVGAKMVVTLTGWDLDFSGLPHWYREA